MIDRRTAPALLALGLVVSGCIPRSEGPDVPPPYRQRGPRTLPPGPMGEPPRGDYPRNEPPPPEQVDPGEPQDYQRHGPDEVQTVKGPPPAWEARPVTADARTVQDGSYVVQPGDTLRGIADRTGAGSEAIARANGLAPPFVVRAGQELHIPGGRYHLVRAGQSGIAIARAYSVPWSRIVAANELSEPYLLRTGMLLVIPGGNRPVTSAERSAAFTLNIDDILTGGQPAPAAEEAPPPERSDRPQRSERAERTAPRPPSRAIASSEPVRAPARFAGRFDWPVRGEVVARFGTGKSGVRNNGIKIAVPVGTPIKAAANGSVAYVGDDVPGLGGLVMLLHGDGWTTVYGHASKILVKRGQTVKRGEVVALSGDTGFADRPELHFEIRKARAPVDPLANLPER